MHYYVYKNVIKNVEVVVSIQASLMILQLLLCFIYDLLNSVNWKFPTIPEPRLCSFSFIFLHLLKFSIFQLLNELNS